MKISIIIPTYKRAGLLLEALDSCLNQTLLPYEIIIGDDSPDDKTQLAVQGLRNPTGVLIRYVHNVPSLKQAPNVNMLFGLVQGDKVMLLHDDDLLMADALETLSAAFAKEPGIEVVYGKQYVIDNDGKIDFEGSEAMNDDYYRMAQYEGAVLTPLEAGLGGQFPSNGYLLDVELTKKVRYHQAAGDACDYNFGLNVGLNSAKMYFVNKYTSKYRLTAEAISRTSTNDATYQSFKLIRDTPAPTERAQAIRERRLREKAPLAITECVNTGRRREALSIYFSQWYRRRALTLPGLKRLLYIAFKFK